MAFNFYGYRLAILVSSLALYSCASSSGVLPIRIGDEAHGSKGGQIQETISFAVIGDVPYSEEDAAMLKTAIAEINTLKLPFVVHVGDYKASSEVCGQIPDDRFADLIDVLDPPIFYTPGDNEWTDCDRESLSPSNAAELDRLKIIRSRFFGVAQEGAFEFGWHSQRGMNENAAWSVGGVRFFTLAVSGTNGGRDEVSDQLGQTLTATKKEIDSIEYNNLLWLKKQFSEAINNKQSVVVVSLHANINNPEKNNAQFGVNCNQEISTGLLPCDAYAELRSQLVAEANAFSGNVLLIHGDTPEFGLSKELRGESVANLWRLDAAGDVRCDNGVPLGVRDVVIVDVEMGSVTPFSVRRLTKDNSPIC